MKLIVGLGNPGPTYSKNRHNIGFLIVDKLIEGFNAIDILNKKFSGELYKKENLLLLKPTTFMNLSGKSVQSVVHFYKINVDDILVIHDEIDLPYGAIRVKKGGGNGGHNGLKSIDSLIGKDYYRLRVGVGRPPKKEMVASYVLSNFSQEEQKSVDKLIEYSAEVAKKWLELPLEELKSKYSKKDITQI